MILSATKSFRAITLVQHTLGLAAGGLLLACWNGARHIASAVLMPLRLHRILGLILAAVYLLSARPIQFEHQLRPEAITPFFALLNIFLTLKFLEHFREPLLSWKASGLGAGVICNSLLLASIKTSFGLTVLFTLAPVLVLLFRKRQSWPQACGVLALSGLVGLFLLATENRLARSDSTAGSFLARSLFTIHANLIADQMDEDIAAGHCGDRGCDWLAAVAASLREEMRRSWVHSHEYESFGFDPDYLMYNPESLRLWTRAFFNGSEKNQWAFYREYYRRTWRAHPIRMIGKIAGQMRLFYSWINPAFDTERTILLRSFYGKTLDNLNSRDEYAETIARYPPASDYLSRCASLVGTKEKLKQGFLLRAANGVLARLYLPLLLGAVLCGLAVWTSPGLRRHLGPLAVITILIYSYNFGNCLGTATFHSLHVTRYNTSQFSFALLSEFIGLMFLIEAGLSAWRSFMPAPTPSPDFSHTD